MYKCRGRNIDEFGNYTFKWFTKESSYLEGNDALAESLTQRLSILKGELWYASNYGIPLFEHYSKAIMDTVVINILLSHPDVKQIKKFNSTLDKNHHYALNFTILSTKEDDLNVNLKF